jgi:hypothetical protein
MNLPQRAGNMDSPNSGDAGFLAIVKRVRFGNARGVGLPLTLVTILFLSKSASQNGSQRCITSARCPAPVTTLGSAIILPKVCPPHSEKCALQHQIFANRGVNTDSLACIFPIF